MAAVALAAAVSSYSGLATLATDCGWHHRLSLLLPLTIDAYAMVATRAWLAQTTARRTRRWARGNAIGAITVSVAGNAASHAATAGVIHITWPIVVAVSAIPSIVLGLITHLWHLVDPPVNTSIVDPAPAVAAPQSVDPRPVPVDSGQAAPPAPRFGEIDPSPTALAPAAPRALPAHVEPVNGAAAVDTDPDGVVDLRADDREPVNGYSSYDGAWIIEAARQVDRWRGLPSATRIGRELGIGPKLAASVAAYLTAEDERAAAPQHQDDVDVPAQRPDTDDAARIIRECWEAGVSVTEAARRAGRDKAQVSRTYDRYDRENHQLAPVLVHANGSAEG
jgi:hypothetical protein